MLWTLYLFIFFFKCYNNYLNMSNCTFINIWNEILLYCIAITLIFDKKSKWFVFIKISNNRNIKRNKNLNFQKFHRFTTSSLRKQYDLLFYTNVNDIFVTYKWNYNGLFYILSDIGDLKVFLYKYIVCYSTSYWCAIYM